MRIEMNIKFSSTRALFFIVIILVLTFSLILSKMSSAACIRGNVQFLTLDAKAAIIYWDEKDCPDNTRTVYYQRSDDGLRSWSGAKRLVSFSDRSIVKTYEPPIKGGSSILTAVALKKGNGKAQIYAKTSTDNASTWSPLTLVKSFSGSFADCPILDFNMSHNQAFLF
jgi:hypothetical protein